MISTLHLGGDPVGLDIRDLVFRMERVFGIEISNDEILKMFDHEEPPDILVGTLFDCMARKAFLGGFIDEELDASAVWPLFQRVVSDALGVDVCEITRERGIIHELWRLW